MVACDQKKKREKTVSSKLEEKSSSKLFISHILFFHINTARIREEI